MGKGLPHPQLSISVLFLYFLSAWCHGMNSAMRERTPDTLEPWKPFIYHLSQALRACILTEPKQFYRGTHMSIDQAFCSKFNAGGGGPLLRLDNATGDYQASACRTAGPN